MPLAIVAVLGFGSAACSSSSSASESPAPATQSSAAPVVPGTVGVTTSDFNIALDSTTAPAGSITFSVSNNGPSVHEFVVFKSDLPADQLPTGSDGDVDESGAGVKHVDELEHLEAGSTGGTLTVDLKAGNYVLICNLPGHYRQGMHAAFTVEG